MSNINLPYGATMIMSMLHLRGYDSYVVGGCVRDSLLGLTPKDWDICTSATPEQVKETFADTKSKIIETGLKHGTVTIVMDDGQYEVTTFRTDGDYSDFRRPDKVVFVRDIKQDLARRDFTINSLAYNRGTLIDLYGGIAHLNSKIISCVGNANDRFNEDALRIMRALRFASVYGFSIDNNTSLAIHNNRDLLSKIAAERINSELCKLLLGKGVLHILLDYSDVLSVIIPELKPCIGFEQNNRFHQYTVYDHIAHAVSNYSGNDISVKLALLLHDIGKPYCYTEDENGGHFHGHAVPGRDLAEKVLDRLRFDNKTKSEVLELVLYHDSVIEPTVKTVRRWLNKIGEVRLKQLLEVRMADILAHADGTQESRIERCNNLKDLITVVLEEQQCFTVKDLSINGDDILRLGIKEGKVIGDTLNLMLDKVINDEVKNDFSELLCSAKKYLLERGEIFE